MVRLVLSAGLLLAPPAGSIDGFVDRELPTSGAPGMAWATVSAEGGVTSGVRGVERLGNDDPVTPESPFVLGSISKSFTALAVMQLVEAGQLDLDDAVSTHLPEFDGAPAAAVTIRQLLSHTSGYSTGQGNSSHADGSGASDDLERAVDVVAQETPAGRAGVDWAYSNVNYQILGRLIEVVSGLDFATYIEVNILDPIGMDDSFVADGDVHAELVSGHVPWFGTKRPLPTEATHRPTAPQGGVVGSVEDVARYMKVMLNGQDDVLSADGKALMLQPASDASPFYGLGWFIDEERGTVWHSGAVPGVETLATMNPSEGTGVVVLVNAGSGLGFQETTELRQGVTARALDFDYAGEGGRWPQKTLFIGLILAPLLYLLSSIWAWHGRDEVRAKSGAFGLFSLWFPLVTTSVGAWVMLWLMPGMFGVPLSTLRKFQPDFALVLTAAAVAGVAWAVFRLGVAYTGSARP